jgi:putative toxin-antitoxin system antitoxin component (TIGR02293 family)
LLDSGTAFGKFRLSRRDQEVLSSISTGTNLKAIAEGLNMSPATVKVHIEKLKRRFGLSTQAELVDLVEKKLEAYRSAASDEDVPDNPTVAAIIDRATAVIGERDAAMRWLGTPVRALDFATPISVLGTAKGAALVEDVLGQIEHGVW